MKTTLRTKSSIATNLLLCVFLISCQGETTEDDELDVIGGRAVSTSTAKNSIFRLQSAIRDAAADHLVDAEEARALIDTINRDGVSITERIVLRTLLDNTRPLTSEQNDLLAPRAREQLEDFYSSMDQGALVPPLYLEDSLGPGKQFPQAWLDATIPSILDGKLDWTDISFRFVKQGSATDCYFLAFVAALAGTYPETLTRAFAWSDQGTLLVTFPGLTRADVSTTQNSSIYYLGDKHIDLNAVSVQDDGIRVEIDLRLPAVLTIDSNGTVGQELLYAKTEPKSRTASSPMSGGYELWPLYLEKAFAKLLGGYDNINGAWPGQVAYPLFLKWTAKRELKTFGFLSDAAKADKLFNLLVEGAPDNRRYVMVGSTCAPTDYSNAGLLACHAYQLIGAFVGLSDNRRYVTLQDPYRRYEPPKELGNAVADADGLFDIYYEDFLKYFGDVLIAMPPLAEDASGAQKTHWQEQYDTLQSL